MKEKHILDPACQDPKQDTLILLEDAIGEIDDDLIQSVDQLRQLREDTTLITLPKKILRREVLKWGSLAACLCVFLGAGFLWTMGGSLAAKSEGMADCLYHEDANEAPLEMENLSDKKDNDLHATSEETLPAMGYILPSLSLSAEDMTISALVGTHSWSWTTSEGMIMHVEADSYHPLELQNSLPEIQTGENALTMAFENASTSPRNITIQCWHEDHWGDISANAATVTPNGNQIPLQEGGYIYEIIVTWSEGTVRYFFYANYTPSND